MKNLRVDLHFHGIFQLQKQNQTIFKLRTECFRVSLYALYFSLILANLRSVYKVAFIPDISQPHKQRVVHLLNSTARVYGNAPSMRIAFIQLSSVTWLFFPLPSSPLLSSPFFYSLLKTWLVIAASWLNIV